MLNDGTLGRALKIQSSQIEINIWFTLAELQILHKVPNSKWEEGSLKIGTSANSSVWWTCDDDEVSLLIGEDGQSWDVGTAFPLKEFLNAIDEQNDT